VTEQSPEFPAPPTDEPTPQIDEAIPLPEVDFSGSRYADDAPQPRRPLLGIPRLAIFGGIGGVLLIVLLLMFINRPDLTAITLALTITDTPENNGSETAAPNSTAANGDDATSAAAGSATTPLNISDFNTPTVRATTVMPTATASPITDTATASATFTATQSPTPTASFTPSNTPTRTPSPTATLPEAGLQGRQDLLALLDAMPAEQYAWNAEQFSPGSGGEFWRLGVGALTEGDIIWIGIPPQILDQRYGNNATSRIRRVEATLSLETFNPPLLLDDAVYFGLIVQDAADSGRSAGLQVQLVQDGVINLVQRSGDDLQTLSQRTVNAVIVRLRLERDVQTGAITLFFNDEQLGDAIALGPSDAPLIPLLFVKDGGVIISVTDWQVTLR
jgi:hypothetical protein